MVQCRTTDELNVEAMKTADPPGCLAYGRECFRQQIVEALAIGQPAPE